MSRNGCGIFRALWRIALTTVQAVLPFHFLERSKDDVLDREQLRYDVTSPLLNLRVFVISGPDKGRLGEIRDASGHDDKFLVNLAVMTAQISRRYSRSELAVA